MSEQESYESFAGSCGYALSWEEFCQSWAWQKNEDQDAEEFDLIQYLLNY